MNIIRYLDWNLATRGSYTSYSHDPAGQWQWLDVSLQKVFNIIFRLIFSPFQTTFNFFVDLIVNNHIISFSKHFLVSWFAFDRLNNIRPETSTSL